MKKKAWPPEQIVVPTLMVQYIVLAPLKTVVPNFNSINIKPVENFKSAVVVAVLM